MRLVKRQELMTLPAGTIYQSFDPNILGELMLKGDNCVSNGENIDWYESPVGASISLNYNRFEMDNCVCREGCFDDDTWYLVHDADDIEWIVARLRGGDPAPRPPLKFPQD